MKKIILICGLIAGAIVSIVMVIATGLCYKTGNFQGNMLLGYASMLLAFSLIFVGIKNYRDNYNQGYISFGKAFRIGLYISLIASTLYVLTWLFNYYIFMPDFGELYAEHMINSLKASGASAAEISNKSAEMAKFAEMYKNPFFNALITYTEILPLGLLVSLICALILKRKKGDQPNFQPA